MENVRVVDVEISVDWNEEWGNAVRLSGPDSDPGLYIFEVGGQYDGLRRRKGVVSSLVHLVGFSGAWQRPAAQDCLAARNWRSARPRQAFAIGEKIPDFHHRLCRQYVSVVSLLPSKFQIRENEVEFVTGTWIADDWRESRLISANYIFQPFCWVIAEDID